MFIIIYHIIYTVGLYLYLLYASLFIVIVLIFFWSYYIYSLIFVQYLYYTVFVGVVTKNYRILLVYL